MTRFFSIHPVRICCVSIALAWVKGGSQAEEPAAFTPPKSYAVSRYEVQWETNPFMLKTTQAVVQNASFAENLVIASVYGSLADPTVVLVNVKTHERIRLRTSQHAGNGIRLDRLHTGNGWRGEMRAKVSQGAETAEVPFGTDYLRQVAAAETARATQAVLQKRQQSLGQHSGSMVTSAASQQQHAASSSAMPNTVTSAAPRQRAWPAAVSSNPSAGGNLRNGQTVSSHNDSHPSTPSLAEDLSGAAHTSLRRYTFRTGDDLPVPHLDPQ